MGKRSIHIPRELYGVKLATRLSKLQRKYLSKKARHNLWIVKSPTVNGNYVITRLPMNEVRIPQYPSEEKALSSMRMFLSN